MEILEYVLGGVILALAVALIVFVLMQTGKDKKLSGAIAGGSDTYFGKTKTQTKDRMLYVVTVVLAIIFSLCVLALYCLVSFKG